MAKQQAQATALTQVKQLEHQQKFFGASPLGQNWTEWYKASLNAGTNVVWQGISSNATYCSAKSALSLS